MNSQDHCMRLTSSDIQTTGTFEFCNLNQKKFFLNFLINIKQNHNLRPRRGRNKQCNLGVEYPCTIWGTYPDIDQERLEEPGSTSKNYQPERIYPRTFKGTSWRVFLGDYSRRLITWDCWFLLVDCSSNQWSRINCSN